MGTACLHGQLQGLADGHPVAPHCALPLLPLSQLLAGRQQELLRQGACPPLSSGGLCGKGDLERGGVQQVHGLQGQSALYQVHRQRQRTHLQSNRCSRVQQSRSASGHRISTSGQEWFVSMQLLAGLTQCRFARMRWGPEDLNDHGCAPTGCGAKRVSCGQSRHLKVPVEADRKLGRTFVIKVFPPPVDGHPLAQLNGQFALTRHGRIQTSAGRSRALADIWRRR